MSHILNFGSLNIDKVYTVQDFVRAGETIASLNLATYPGGKGLNQSIALAKSQSKVYHIGFIGEDGLFLKELLEKEGVDTSFLETVSSPSGHAIIQVNKDGQNCILLHPGANNSFTKEAIDHVLASFDKDDAILVQNEINEVDYIIEKAHEKGLTIFFNPSPITPNIKALPLQYIDYFILNETEGAVLSGESQPKSITDRLLEQYPDAKIVLTLGEDGVIYKDCDHTYSCPIFPVDVVDTTAAGDTFTGFFISSLLAGKLIPDCLKIASKASSLAVSKAGAACSIPSLGMLDALFI